MEPARAAVRTLLTGFRGDQTVLYAALWPTALFWYTLPTHGKCITLALGMRRHLVDTSPLRVCTTRHDRQFELDGMKTKKTKKKKKRQQHTFMGKRNNHKTITIDRVHWEFEAIEQKCMYDSEWVFGCRVCMCVYICGSFFFLMCLGFSLPLSFVPGKFFDTQNRSRVQRVKSIRDELERIRRRMPSMYVYQESHSLVRCMCLRSYVIVQLKKTYTVCKELQSWVFWCRTVFR